MRSIFFFFKSKKFLPNLLTRFLWDSADIDKLLKSPSITGIDRFTISLISGVLCLTFFLSPHFTLYKATKALGRMWVRVVRCQHHGKMWKSLGSDERTQRLNVKEEKNTWARVKYSGCKGITGKLWDKSVSWDMVGKERKNCDFSYDRFFFPLQTCRNHWLPSVSNQKAGFVSPSFNQLQSKQLHLS